MSDPADNPRFDEAAAVLGGCSPDDPCEADVHDDDGEQAGEDE